MRALRERAGKLSGLNPLLWRFALSTRGRRNARPAPFVDHFVRLTTSRRSRACSIRGLGIVGPIRNKFLSADFHAGDGGAGPAVWWGCNVRQHEEKGHDDSCSIRLSRPETLDEAVKLLKKHGDEAKCSRA